MALGDALPLMCFFHCISQFSSQTDGLIDFRVSWLREKTQAQAQPVFFTSSYGTRRVPTTLVVPYGGFFVGGF
jgi:hypothetical protein